MDWQFFLSHEQPAISEIKYISQHGFKRKKSTATAGALLQSIISRAADDNYHVVMASLDLSMAFDLINVSACALRSCFMSSNSEISFEKIHELYKKCTPTQIMNYQCSIQLHKIINFEIPCFEAVTVLNQMTSSRRQTLFLTFRDNSTKIGMNTTANKFYHLTGKITLNSLNLSFVHFKKMIQIQFLKFVKT